MWGMRRDLVIGAGAASAVVVLTMWISSADDVWFSRGGDPPPPEVDVPRSVPEPIEGQKVAEPTEQPTADDGWFGPLSTALLVLLVLVLLALLLRREADRRRRRRRRLAITSAATDAGPSDLAEPQVVAAELLARTDDLSSVLLTGEPRNAIVACWVQLEDACARIGLRRGRAETSMEFTHRVLATYAVGPGPIDDLADLYREARFSEHVLTEDHRQRAVRALTELTGRLRDRAGAAGRRQ